MDRNLPRKMLAMLLSLWMLLSLSACAEENTGETTPGETVLQAAEATTWPPETTEAAQLQPERFLLTFVGDCTLGADPLLYYAKLGYIRTVGDDYGYPFRNVATYFRNDEFTFINLEGPLCDEGHPVEKTHTFRGPTDYINILTQNSVEMVSLANNHTMDYAQTGYDSTLRTLNEVGIPYVERDASTIVTTPSGLTIGLYGAVYYCLDVEDMTAEIAALRQQGCDLVIYAPHWGAEKTYAPTAEQVEVGHAAIDAGADIVWGSHSHTLQPIEYYGTGVIFYSMGNFSFGGNGMPEDFDTALIQQEVIRQPDGTVSLGELTIVPCAISSVPKRNNYQPTPYEPGTEDYERVLAKLAGTW